MSQGKQAKINGTMSNWKAFCTAEETIIKIKRPLTEWENIFSNNISDKGLIIQNI